MAEIIYFGTNGSSGHYPIGIDKTLTGDEYGMWCECDNDVWINNIRENPGRHLIKQRKRVLGRNAKTSAVRVDKMQRRLFQYRLC